MFDINLESMLIKRFDNISLRALLLGLVRPEIERRLPENRVRIPRASEIISTCGAHLFGRRRILRLSFAVATALTLKFCETNGFGRRCAFMGRRREAARPALRRESASVLVLASPHPD